jgi:hypothetical protein
LRAHPPEYYVTRATLQRRADNLARVMQRLVIAIGLMLAASTGRADPASADRIASEANARADAKDYLGAAAKFREAYAAYPRADFICNAGVAYYKAQEVTRAQLFLARCLERGALLGDKFMQNVRAALAKLEATLRSGSFTPVDIVVEPRFATVSVSAFAADETFEGERTVWVRFGTYTVTVRAEGYIEHMVSIEATHRAIVPVRVTLVKQPVEPVRREPAPAPSGSAATPVTGRATAAAHPERASPSLAPPIVASVVAIGLAGSAVYARSIANDHADRAGFALRQSTYQTEADATRRWNRIFSIDVALTGVAMVASSYLWYRATKHPSAAAVDVTAHTASIVVRRAF